MVRPRFKKAETLDLDRILHIHQLSQPSSVVQAGWHRNGAKNAPHDQTASPALAPSWSWTWKVQKSVSERLSGDDASHDETMVRRSARTVLATSLGAMAYPRNITSCARLTECVEPKFRVPPGVGTQKG
jgi:hypothetical protein